MCCWRAWLLLSLLSTHCRAQDTHGPDLGLGQLVAGQWRCMLDDLVSGRGVARVFKPTSEPCFPDVTVHLYSASPLKRKLLDPRRPGWLRWSGWNPHRKTVILVHGFNGGLDKAPMTALRDAYLEQGASNVLVLDWAALSRYPCYADAVRQTRSAARCGAQVVSALQASLGSWAAADGRQATCVGHSLGAHICGMLSRMLPFRLAKIVALDPAKPQVYRLLGDDILSSTDARLVQSFHSNVGFYGEYPSVPNAVHAAFCFNGGRMQPDCDHGTRFVRMRCSHFLSVCYYAQLVRGRQPGVSTWTSAVPCDSTCSRLQGLQGLQGLLGQSAFPVKLTEAGVDRWRGTHCVDFRLSKPCRIDL